jgi:hypothetical protein
METKRAELVEGTMYYMDGSKRDKGVFMGRDEESIFFDCGEDTYYGTSRKKGKEKFVGFFHDGPGGFVEVK